MLAPWQPKRTGAASRAPRLGLGALLALGAALGAGAASAAEVRVEVAGLRNAEGTLYVAVCTEAEFLRPACAHSGRAPAAAGTVTVAGVPPGLYAVQAVHDENDNQALDRPGLLPTEGLGFSRDAPMRRGPPRFADAAFELGDASAAVPLTMRYFQ